MIQDVTSHKQLLFGLWEADSLLGDLGIKHACLKLVVNWGVLWESLVVESFF